MAGMPRYLFAILRRQATYPTRKGFQKENPEIEVKAIDIGGLIYSKRYWFNVAPGAVETGSRLATWLRRQSAIGPTLHFGPCKYFSHSPLQCTGKFYEAGDKT